MKDHVEKEYMGLNYCFSYYYYNFVIILRWKDFNERNCRIFDHKD